ncbi:tetratricopeptide repeat-containing protein [uncultured Erythrobacter sp.]|uniref:tetratricopeptide repeat-containing protein n=1 Tax=uncultured Erythrobacter sp. TaxID=263913 RepID=UPI0026300288|nr:tetratricopeptide repeat-containing protein [uncultured Erythrobacter sp.]
MTPTHQTILALARAGNPVRAWSLFQSSGLSKVENDPKVFTLKGRLLKDLARRASGDERNRLYSQASDAYLAANALGEDSYPLINAAALACFAGDHARAGRIAQDVLQLIENDPNEGETAYWREATRAEAHLLLRQMDQATAALALAYKRLPFAHEDQAATLGQFDRILEAQGEEALWLEPFRVPCSVNFVSNESTPAEAIDTASDAVKAIASSLEDLSPGYGFGGLLSVPDLLFAEQALECGAELTLTFPFEPDDVGRDVFAPHGADWERRFHRAIANAALVETLPSAIAETQLSNGEAKTVTQLVAMGQSLRKSEALRSRAHAMVWPQSGHSNALGLALWSAAGLPVCEVQGTKLRPVAPNRQDKRASLSGLVLTNDPEALGPVAERYGLSEVVEGNGLIWRGTMERVIDAALSCSQHTDTTLAVHLGLPDSHRIWDGLSERMERLARANHRAKVKMGLQSAMIAKIVRPALRIEELGEIQTLSGHASIWSAIV